MPTKQSTTPKKPRVRPHMSSPRTPCTYSGEESEGPKFSGTINYKASATPSGRENAERICTSCTFFNRFV